MSNGVCSSPAHSPAIPAITGAVRWAKSSGSVIGPHGTAPRPGPAESSGATSRLCQPSSTRVGSGVIAAVSPRVSSTRSRLMRAPIELLRTICSTVCSDTKGTRSAGGTSVGTNTASRIRS